MRLRILLAASAMFVVPTGCAGTSTEQVSGLHNASAGSSAPARSSASTTAAPDCADLLPPSGQAGQLLMVMVPDPSVATAALKMGTIGGFGLKGNQRSDVAKAISAAVADAPLPATVASDEEGGTVQRLRYSAGVLPGASKMADGKPHEAAMAFEEHAKAMLALGVNMNFSPVADVGSGVGLESRTYSDDPAVVSSFVDPIIKANLAGGVTPVVKHWPGIGGVRADPHKTLPVLAPLEELRQSGLVPFTSAISAGAPAVMVAHAEVPGLTAKGEPTSLSREAISGELRGREGFHGLVITDSLGMGAVVNTVPQDEAAEKAIAAGADIALLSGIDAVEPAHRRLQQAIEEGRIPAEQVTASVRRVLATKGIKGECFDAVAAYTTTRTATDDTTTTGGTTTNGTTTGGTTTGGTTTGGTTTGGTTTGGTASDNVADQGINAPG